MKPPEELTAKYPTWARALEFYAACLLGGGRRWANWKVVAEGDGQRRCHKCGKTHEVRAGEVVRSFCPLCGARDQIGIFLVHGVPEETPVLVWVGKTGRRVKGPKLSVNSAPRGASEGLNPVDWKIGYERWVMRERGRQAIAIVQELALSTEAEPVTYADVGRGIGATGECVRWVVRRLRDEWEG